MRVLFFSDGDACRGPMAEGFLRELGGDAVVATSAGVEARPLEPSAVQAMRDGLMAHAKGAGRLWLEISKEDLIPSSVKVGKGSKPAASPQGGKPKSG